MATLPAWLDYISHQHSAEIVMGLDRVRSVWNRMRIDGVLPGAPLNIVVGGTNGKGSTCAMLESILHIGGYRTGLFTSPHLHRYNERVRITRQEASDSLIMASFAAVEAARVRDVPVPLTYFEYSTLSALWIFAEQQVDVAVLEVGLGGRLDAVNMVDADASILVSVDLDHQQYLGDTREKIGLEKAHIFRPGRPAIFADLMPPDSVVRHAGQIGANFLQLNRDYQLQRMDNQWQVTGAIEGRNFTRHALPFPALRGAYQLKNAAAGIVALAALQTRLPVSIGHIKRGLLEVEWPGRMQVLPGQPSIVLDVAHNPHAARALNDALGSMGFFECTHAVFGMLKDKDIDTVIEVIRGRIDHWHIAGLEGERGASASLLASKLAAHGLAAGFTSYTSMANAFAGARERAGQNDRILVFGSFLTVTEVLAALKKA
jgi:dihydrofolate synthase/folylpolyglutamate synthase